MNKIEKFQKGINAINEYKINAKNEYINAIFWIGKD